MAENVLDIDVSQLAGGEIVNDIILEENKNESPKLQTENTNDIVDIDVSQLSGGEINEDVNNKILKLDKHIQHLQILKN